MAIRMRRGNEADFDPSKMLPGEWAVSTDTKYVRMCFSPGIVLRMATYEAFESDMAEMRKILSECQSIQTAVELIQKNVTNSELVIENYVKEAKQYRDEAEQFRNEASMFAPEGYEDLVKNVSDNTVKIDTIIEKAELNIKNNAKGSNIHLTDSADSNVVALELYGKTEQKAYTGKNLLDCSGLTETTLNGGTFTPVYDDNGYLKYVNVNGTFTAQTSYYLMPTTPFEKGSYIFNGCPSGGSSATYSIYNDVSTGSDTGNGKELNLTNTTNVRLRIVIGSGYTANNLKFYPMISVEGGEYEPYVGGMPSPSPDYPQEIKSVVLNTIKTRSKNLLDLGNLTERTTYGVTFTPVYDSNGKLLYINANGLSTNDIQYNVVLSGIPIADKNTYLFNGVNGGSTDTYTMTIFDANYQSVTVSNGETVYWRYNTEIVRFRITILSGVTMNNVKFYPMISKEGGEYQPYQSTEITLSESIELNGFNGVYDVVTSDGVTRKFAEVMVLSSFDWTVSGGDAGADGHCFQTRMYSELFAKNTNEYVLTNALCTHFIIKKSGDLYFKSSDEIGDGIAIFQNTNGYNVIRCRNTDCSSLADFKTWLDENEVYLVYELATPTTEALQIDFTALKTFYPETHVSNNADCDMSITYTADAKNYIDNKIALLTTAIYNNI